MSRHKNLQEKNRISSHNHQNSKLSCEEETSFTHPVSADQTIQSLEMLNLTCACPSDVYSITGEDRSNKIKIK